MGNENDPEGAWQRQTTTSICGHEVLEQKQVHYCDWVGAELLALLSQPFAGSPAARDPLHPDEQQFLRVHQVEELMFAQIYYDLQRAIQWIQKNSLVDASHVMRRVVTWTNLLSPVAEIFETMRPEDFAKFRTALSPASGAESLGGRRIEVLSGQGVDEPYAEDRGMSFTYRQCLDRSPGPGPNDPKTRWWTDELTQIASGPTLRSAFAGLLQREATTLEDLYELRAPEDPLRVLADYLYNFDQAYTRFRAIHFKIATQQIGTKPGTGHTSGAAFLRSTLDKHFLPDLWNLKKRRRDENPPPKPWGNG